MDRIYCYGAATFCYRCKYERYKTYQIPSNLCENSHSVHGKLTKEVELQVRRILPDRFTVIFDGWTTGDCHYVAVYAAFPSTSRQGYNTILLAFSPLENETSHNAGFALSDRHKNILTANFEMQIFLNSNNSLWSIADVSTILSE